MFNNWPFAHPVNPEVYDNGTDWPKISIVTPSYNQGQFIEETILSILNQNYPNLEYIIIDGGSTDNTVDIIKKYEDRITYWVSEKDNGQSHALNKGFAVASGEIFAYINSDDCYYPHSFKTVVDEYSAQKITSDKLLIIGNCYWGTNLTDFNGWIDVPHFPDTLFSALIKRGLASQPSMFWTNPIKLKFNEDLKFCMDFDFWLKLIVNNYKVSYVRELVSLFRLHEDSKTSNLAQVQNDELNGLSFLYKKYLTVTENIELTDFLLSKTQFDLYDKIINHEDKSVKFKYLCTLIKSNLNIKNKIKAFVRIL